MDYWHGRPRHVSIPARRARARSPASSCHHHRGRARLMREFASHRHRQDARFGASRPRRHGQHSRAAHVEFSGAERARRGFQRRREREFRMRTTRALRDLKPRASAPRTVDAGIPSSRPIARHHTRIRERPGRHGARFGASRPRGRVRYSIAADVESARRERARREVPAAARGSQSDMSV